MMGLSAGSMSPVPVLVPTDLNRGEERYGAGLPLLADCCCVSKAIFSPSLGSFVLVKWKVACASWAGYNEYELVNLKASTSVQLESAGYRRSFHRGWKQTLVRRKQTLVRRKQQRWEKRRPLLPSAKEPFQKACLDGGGQAPPSSWIDAPGLLGLIPGRLLKVWVFRALSDCSWKSSWLSKVC